MTVTSPSEFAPVLVPWLAGMDQSIQADVRAVPHGGRPYLLVCAGVLLVQAVVGLAGFLLHASAVLRQPAATLFEKILSGAPPMAPLFPNLAVLGFIGLSALAQRTKAQGPV